MNRLRTKAVVTVAAQLALLVGTFGLMVGAAQARPASAPELSPKMTVSPNWSGYVASAPHPNKVHYGHPYFTHVTGTWTVPTATCNPRKGASSSTVWVGLGGYRTTNQEEVGTNSNCSATGKPVYFAWFELVPYLAYQTFPTINAKVDAGDTITGTVTIISPLKVELKVENRTRGWTFDKKINFSSQDTTTADWVVEAPATCVKFTCQQASLANFGSVAMRNISATGRGETGTLTNSHWNVIPVRLVPTKLTVPVISPVAISSGHNGKKGQAKSPAGATPGKFSADGSSFGVKWIAVAKGGL